MQCESNSSCAITLTTTFEQFIPINSEELFAKLFHGKGCSFQKPFTAVEIGYTLYKYDLKLFEQRTNALFEKLIDNQKLIGELSNNTAVTTTFVININSMTSDERPLFFLSNSQIAFLAKICSSLTFDGYLMFGDADVS